MVVAAVDVVDGNVEGVGDGGSGGTFVDVKVVAVVVAVGAGSGHTACSPVGLRAPLNPLKAVVSTANPAGEEHAMATTDLLLAMLAKAWVIIMSHRNAARQHKNEVPCY